MCVFLLFSGPPNTRTPLLPPAKKGIRETREGEEGDSGASPRLLLLLLLLLLRLPGGRSPTRAASAAYGARERLTAPETGSLAATADALFFFTSVVLLLLPPQLLYLAFGVKIFFLFLYWNLKGRGERKNQPPPSTKPPTPHQNTLSASSSCFGQRSFKKKKPNKTGKRVLFFMFPVSLFLSLCYALSLSLSLYNILFLFFLFLFFCFVSQLEKDKKKIRRRGELPEFICCVLAQNCF